MALMHFMLNVIAQKLHKRRERAKIAKILEKAACGMIWMPTTSLQDVGLLPREIVETESRRKLALRVHTFMSLLTVLPIDILRVAVHTAAQPGSDSLEQHQLSSQMKELDYSRLQGLTGTNSVVHLVFLPISWQ